MLVLNKEGKKMGRTLHLVDAENLALTSNCTIEGVRDSYLKYSGLFEDASDDLRIIACSHHNATAVFFGWSGLASQPLMRSGENGAELALIEACISQVDRLNVSHVVIGSGDGLFVDLVLELQNRGIEVTVVGVEGHTSARLRLAANHVILIENPISVEGVKNANA
jgi:hypothetical protein